MAAFGKDHDVKHLLPRARRRSPLVGWTVTATAAVLGAAVLAAGCGGSNPPSTHSGLDKSNNAPPSTASSSALMAHFLAYARCMRRHGLSDFPDPTGSGGVGITLHGGPGSDLNPNNPKFQAATEACRALQPGAHPATAPSPEKIAAEVKWARCMRLHGLPNFPDPDSRGAFDSSKFNDSSPAFQAARNACKPMEAAMGSVSAVPGRG
jgi:hypothetical protein